MWYRIVLATFGIHPKEKEAVEFYGVTDNPQLAGYILSDGRFLDYSEGGYEISLDHRNIENIMDDPEESKGSRYSDYVEPFMKMTGAIRASNYGCWDLDIFTPPTAEQMRIIISHHNKIFDRRNMDGDGYFPDFHIQVDPLGIKETIPNATKEAVSNKLLSIRNQLLNVV